jgi:hypothetical protein
MNSGQIVDRNDADQYGRQFDQDPFEAIGVESFALVFIAEPPSLVGH